MKNLTLKFYSVLKNEDAVPFAGNNILAVADGLGGSGSEVHAIDRKAHPDVRGDILSSAFGDALEFSPTLSGYVEDLVTPMADDRDDTSALWASRIVIARLVYALTEGKFTDADLSDETVRAQLAEFISQGLDRVAQKFDLKKGRYDGQLLFPTTLAFIRYSETENTVIAETVWAGDSRCYALTKRGLRLLSVDDEDGSGAITNEFYAGNKKVLLNYIRHEIEKPCVLMAVSDGVFDPFEPYDHLGVEHSFLSAMKASKSEAELASELKKIYDGIRNDDATAAFAAPGFSGYDDMKETLAERTDEILSLREKQVQAYSALEVLDSSEEEVSHYVLTRTGDRYDYIVSVLTDAVERNENDIAIAPEIKRIADGVKKHCDSVVKKAGKQNRESAFAKLNAFIREHPERVISEVLTKSGITFNDDLLKNAYVSFTKAAHALNPLFSGETELDAVKRELDARKKDIHLRVLEKIKYYREKFDAFWDVCDQEGQKNRSEVYGILSVWTGIDNALFLNWSLQNLAVIPESERELTGEVQDYLNDFKIWRLKKNSAKNTNTKLLNDYLNAWKKLCEYLKEDDRLVPVILNADKAREFGFDLFNERISAMAAKQEHDRIADELKVKKVFLVPEIVKALAANFDKTSLIDGQYNATKLERFRTYYRLQSAPDDDAKYVKNKLAELEKDYISLVTE